MGEAFSEMIVSDFRFGRFFLRKVDAAEDFLGFEDELGKLEELKRILYLYSSLVSL